jgi:hypothetical protein
VEAEDLDGALQRLEALGDAPWASMSAAHAPS